MIPIWMEPCCGSAAVSLCLAGGLGARPPISYVGSKRRFATQILRVLGLSPGEGAEEYRLSDAGPWGEVWDLVTETTGNREVQALLRGWEGKELSPHSLRVCCADPSQDGPGVWPALRVARWLVAAGWAFRAGSPDSGSHPGIQRSAWGAWDPVAPARLSTVAARLAPVPGWMPRVSASRCRAEDLPIPEALPAWSVVYLDPPYAGTTGYGAGMSREGVLDLARAWARTGATVAISEAVGLAGDLGPGWWEVEIASHHKNGMNHGKARMEWITLNREPVWRPSVQVGLFGGEQ